MHERVRGGFSIAALGANCGCGIATELQFAFQN
jgi:hypothetical protein